MNETQGIYTKDFDNWSPLKKEIDAKELNSIPYFKEREIWFSHVGCNVGYEQDGKTGEFWRPVLVVKKYNGHLFMGIPLTSKIKPFPFYYEIGEVAGSAAAAILSQMKPFSSKRLINKLETLSQAVFEATKKAASEYIFGS